jgi:hypothetical protein
MRRELSLPIFGRSGKGTRVMAMDAPVSADDRPRDSVTDVGSDHLPSPSPARPAAPVRRWPWILLRVTLVLQALDAFLQPVLAGRFLSGDFGMLAAHAHNATYGVFVLAVLQIAVTALAWRLAKGPGSLVIVSVVLAGAVLLQIILGFDRVLGVHIPLGVAIITIIGWLAVWVCRHQPSDRPFNRSRRATVNR